MKGAGMLVGNLMEINWGVAQAFLTPKRDYFKTQTNTNYSGSEHPR